jgi:putative flippase GtrA
VTRVPLPPFLPSSLPPLLRRYTAAGTPAVILDGIIFSLLCGWGASPNIARALAVFLGTGAAYFLHGKYTYATQHGAKTAKGDPVPFAALQLMAGAINFAVFARILYALPQPAGLDGLLTAFVLGGLAGSCFHYFMLRRLLPVTAEERPDATQPAGRYKRTLLWLLIACIAAETARGHYQAVLQFPKLPYPLGPPDPDVWLYLTQTRQWLEGLSAHVPGAFFDHSVRHTNAPVGGITTPWTRPMIFLVSLAYFFMPHSLPMEVRLMLGATWLAPALGLAAIALLARAARAQFNSLHAAGFAGLLMVANPDTFNWYSPGDIDHHGLLSMLWCGALAVLMQDTISDLAALVLGAILGTTLWISPEGLLLAGAVYGVMGAEIVLSRTRAAATSRALVFAGLGGALAVTLAVFIEMPAGAILATPAYDTVSIVHVTLLWLTTAGAGLLALACRKNPGFGTRLASAAGAAALIAGCMFALYPKFFLGPFTDATSYYLEESLPNIGENKPLLSVSADDIVRDLMEPVLALALIGFALAHKKLRAARLRRLLLLLALLLATTGMTFIKIRWGYYLHPVAIVAIASTAASLGLLLRWPPLRRLAPKLLTRHAIPYVALWLAFIVMNVVIHQVQKPEPEDAGGPNCLSQVRYALQSQQLPPLLGGKDLVLFVSADAGGDALFFSPYSIIASNFHREGPALKELDDIAAMKTAAEARPMLAKRKVSALLVCPDDYAKTSWLHGLGATKTLPGWLKPAGEVRLFYPPDGIPPLPDAKPLLLKAKP